MFANWKSAVYEYAHRRNRLEIDGEAGELASMIRDDRFVRKLEGRLRRLQASRKARRAEPLRSETGLKIANADDADREAVVELEFRRSTEYGQLGQTFREERLERERVTITKNGNQWIITGVEPVMGERRSMSAPVPAFSLAESEDEAAMEARLRSVPYLNYRVLPSVTVEPVYRHAAYDRAKARRYAEKWWNGTNPQYMNFEVDCTNFVSQCLFAGGAPMNYTGKRESGWWYKGKDGSRELWSFSWAVAHSLQSYLSSSKSGLRSEQVDSPHRLAIGDVICYDWDGNGRFQHNTIVTGLDAVGMPLVNAHTADSRARYWDYRDSYAWTPNTRYRFFHIADYF
jgi:cell wall-associated NlpC family hydrolase